jgi:hypothetical protein
MFKNFFKITPRDLGKNKTMLKRIINAGNKKL